MDTQSGYDCRCRAGYKDQSPDRNRKGRVCLLNECESPTTNKCDKNAKCVDTEGINYKFYFISVFRWLLLRMQGKNEIKMRLAINLF